MPKLADPERPCHGCAHSAASVPFPGHPSGERPCGFCIRNPWDESYCLDDQGRGVWYDGEPAYKTPMDCYIATDRLKQQQVWGATDRIKRGEQEVTPRGDGYEFYRITGMEPGMLDQAIKDGAPPCCQGGDFNGHAGDCMFVVGISFG